MNLYECSRFSFRQRTPVKKPGANVQNRDKEMAVDGLILLTLEDVL